MTMHVCRSWRPTRSAGRPMSSIPVIRRPARACRRSSPPTSRHRVPRRHWPAMRPATLCWPPRTCRVRRGACTELKICGRRMAQDADRPAGGGAAGAAPPTPPGSQPLRGAQLAFGTVALSLATFMNVLDTSIANVSLPSIAGDLGVSPDQGTWVITSFGVANAISLPLTGSLTRRFGQVRLFTTSVVLFVIASFLCALAPTLSLLILARVLQGAVAGPMIPLSQALLLSSYPKNRAGSALAMWSITTLVAPVVGPLLGGWITDNISWPWIFYINVPVGIAAAGATWMIFRKRETPTAKVPVDTVGLGLLVLWVGALQVMLDKGKDLDWFNSTQIVALAVVAAVAFVVFMIWELTEEHPIVDLHLFQRRNFWVATLALLL